MKSLLDVAQVAYYCYLLMFLAYLRYWVVCHELPVGVNFELSVMLKCVIILEMVTHSTW